MDHFNYAPSPFPVRADLAAAYREYWRSLARPGNWFSGAERVAIAAEVRHAVVCPFCAQRKQALSPYQMAGEHQHGNALPPAVVDAVHRVITDQSRITGSYVAENNEHGLPETHYVELAGIAVIVFSIDEFHRSLGLQPEPLPEPEPGEPDHYRPVGAQPGGAFVAMLPDAGVAPAESDLWPAGRGANVLRALSLVPDAVRNWQAVGAAQYLSIEQIGDFTADTGRALNRMQMELVAGRVSSVNECFY